MDAILHLCILWFGKFCSKAGRKYQHCTQHAIWHYLTHSSNLFFFQNYEIMNRHLVWWIVDLFFSKEAFCWDRWFPMCLSLTAAQQQRLFLALWSGMMGWLLSQLYCHLSRWPGERKKRSPHVKRNWRYQNLLSRERTLFSHSWRHANTTLTKQQSGSLTALLHCPMLSHARVGSSFAAGPPVRFQARHKVPVHDQGCWVFRLSCFLLETLGPERWDTSSFPNHWLYSSFQQ